MTDSGEHRRIESLGSQETSPTIMEGTQMGFKLPTFNLPINIWRGTHDPRVDPPDITGVMGNLQFAPKRASQVNFQVIDTPAQFASNTYCFYMYLLLPALTDVRPGWSPTYGAVKGCDFVEVPISTGRFYVVVAVDDVSKGFPTEYRVAGLLPSPPWPVPIA